MLKQIKSYIREVQFGMIVIVCVVCLILIAIQFGFMFGLQSQNITWEGVCKGGELSNGGDNRTNMTVHCPLQEEFVINDPYVIAASKNEGKVFYCQRTLGTVMKNEQWSCTTPKGED